MAFRTWTGDDTENAPRAAVWHNEVQQNLLVPATPNLIAYAADVVIQTTFQSGHGFTSASPSTGSQADDTSTYLLGTQSLKLTTAGTGGTQATRKTGMTALDATGKYLKLRVMVDHPERLTSLRLDVSSDTFTNWSTSDHISPSTNATSPFFVPNEWIELLIPWGSFSTGGGAGATRSALTGFQVRCTDDGTGVVNMWVQSISTVSEPANAVVTLTFDDGYASAESIAKPILDAVGYRACFGPIVSKVGVTNYMTMDQLKRLRDAGWEPLVHAYDIAVHNNYDGSSDLAVMNDVLAAKAWMRENGFGHADNFIIPQGQITTTARTELWRRFFHISRTAYTRNRETYPPARRWGTRVYTLSPAHGTADVQSKIDEAIANKEWLILEIHDIVASGGDGSTTYLTADFQTVVNYLVSQSVKVKTISEVLRTGVA